MKKIISVICLFIVIIFLIGAGLNKRYRFIQTDSVAKRIYSQGLDDLKNDDLQNAYYNFSKISKYNSFYEAALFRQGLISSELNDNQSAIKAYETLLYKFPNTFFAQKSIYNLAVAYFNSNNPEKAYANFKVITKKYPDSDYADAANYFLGVLAKNNNKEESAKYFKAYIDDAPNGKYGLLAVDELTALDRPLTKEDSLSIGKTLLANGKNEEALNYLNSADFSDAWAYITIAKKNLGSIKESKQTFEEGIEKYSKNGDDAQEQAVEVFAKTFKNRTAGLKEAKFLCDKSKCKINDYIMFNLISSVDKQTKIDYYNRIFDEFPDGDYAAEALFNSLFNDYSNGSYDNAIIKAKRHISKYPDKKSAPASLYWMGKSYEKKNNVIEANIQYNKISNKYPDTYYAYLAAAKLSKMKDPFNVVINADLPEEIVIIDLPILHTNIAINSTKKADELLKVGDFKIFENADFDNDLVKSWVAYYEGNHTKASVIAEKQIAQMATKPTFDDDIYKLAYPIKYGKLINEYSKNSEIKPYLLISLIKKESTFNPNAVSSVGASGLTQLMPQTAKFIAAKSGINYSSKELFDPEYNISLGVKYFDYIKKSHHSNDMLALASYNGGHGAVSKWLNSYGTIADENLDEFVEKIPFPETKEYVKQIYKNYWVYLNIYSSSKVR